MIDTCLMPRTLQAAAMAVLLLSAAACGGPERDALPPKVTVTSPTELVVPSLRLPSAAPGGECPAAEPRPWSGPGEAYRVLGLGPVYPVADYFPDGVLGLRPTDRQADGTYVKKVRWIAAGYTGPVLVRAGRIDGEGTASAKFSYRGEPRDGGHYAVLTNEESDLPATTTVSGPGCYAYQVDGTTFSVTIVFRAVPAPADE